MIDISFRKILIFGIILTLVFTSLSPSIVGVKEDNHNTIEIDNLSNAPVISNKNIVSIPTIYDIFDFSISNQNYNLNPINKVREFFNLELMYPTLKTGFWDYTIKGFVTDASTNEPIENARISFFWIGNRFFYGNDETFSNSNGFYEKSLEKIFYGLIWFLVSADGYYTYDRTIFEVENDLDIWINVSLTPGAPPKNSKVCGYVLDADNGVPIEGANVIVIWEDYEDHTDWLSIFSDSTGYYSCDVAPGIVTSGCYKDNYNPKARYDKGIEDGETLWFNHYLYPIEPDTATICGYVKDEITGNPIEDVLVVLDLFNYYQEYQSSDFNYTFTDSSGYFEAMTRAGQLNLEFYTPVHSRYRGHAHIKIENHNTYWWNDTLYKIPPRTATICGNITDEITHKPINNARVYINWIDEEQHDFYWTKETEESGFYKFDLPPGELDISAYESYYFGFEIDDIKIDDNETIWLDITLEPTPPELSIVHGYITGNKSGTPIKGDSPVKHAWIHLFWEDDLGRGRANSTYTDSDGYYKMNVAAGKIRLSVSPYEYYWAESQEYTIEDHETIEIDLTLETEKHDIEILKPKGGIYLNNKKVFPFFIPIIVGNIDIEVNVSEHVYEVEFYIDGKFKHADIFDHGYTWDKLSFGKHKITVVGNGYPYYSVIKDIRVWKFF